ncbi:helix-turn-helix domain-containing protein [Kribbella sp. CA-294648]|uniref:helix-turn-helix domain-containing protein n=1 Tax=Kribbella sp. CA-294648 TaxID=3239948 RepID=UPI003D94EF7D
MTQARTHVPDVGPEAPFADALRAAIAHRGLALNRIQARLADRGLHVGVATLSTWQNGSRHPRTGSLAVVTALEELLDLPAGWLAVRIPPAVEAPTRPYAVVANASTLTRLLDEVRRDAHGRLRSVTVVEEIVIGADHSLTAKRVIQTMVAVREADRQIVVHQGELGSDAAKIVPRGLTGCRTGRVARDPDGGAVLGELLLDRTLAVGDTAVVHYEIADLNGFPSTQYFRFHEWAGTHHVLEIQFHREALPVRVTEFRRHHSGEPDVLRRELMMTPDGRVHVVVPAASPGVIGIDWEWD